MVSFLSYVVTFYEKSLQLGDVFSLGSDFYNKYFQVCKFLSEFHKHLTRF